MYRGKRVAALIVAAGAGRRMDAETPKQFMKFGGKTVLAMAAEVFGRSALIDDVYVVAGEGFARLCRETIENEAVRAADKLRRIVTGGATRQASVYAGLAALSRDVDTVLIHDAARPFVSEACVERVTRDAAEKGAAIAAIPLHDTIKRADAGFFTETLDRRALFAAQTPQGFDRTLITEAHEQARAEGCEATDDAALVERLGERVYVSEGERGNIKLTTPEDASPGLRPGEASDRAVATRVGIGCDAHRLTTGRPLVLGGVEIPFEKGLAGHSDADVLVHAVADAALGAAALGDIGKLFPDTDARYEGARSTALLAEVTRAVARAGYAVLNADVTVTAQRPKLAPYTAAMCENVARALGTTPDRVSVKATTTEGLGFTGREEGIAAQAVVLLTNAPLSRTPETTAPLTMPMRIDKGDTTHETV